jgi:carbamate kinase
MSFVRRTGASGLITDPANLGKALAGRAGTWIVAS